MADEQEDWQVPQRRGLIAAVTLPLVLAGVVLLAARLYDRDLRPLHRQPVTTFPAPGVETFIHDGQGDPKRRPPRPTADPALAAAKRATVTNGLAGWTAR